MDNDSDYSNQTNLQVMLANQQIQILTNEMPDMIKSIRV